MTTPATTTTQQPDPGPRVLRGPVGPLDAAAHAVESVTGALPVVVTVTAVVVTRGHTRFLARSLAALGAQGHAPDDVVVVDVGTSASMRDYRDLQLGSARFVAAPHARTFGQAVDAALDAAPAGTWLWLLHDDSAPDPGALDHLVRSVEHSSSVAVAGVKQRGWDDDDVLLEVGFTVSPLGRRMTGIELGEIDQGQHDARDDVLAVGLAGALVRRSVWDDLGGTDPELGRFGDGQDLCRRARLAGHRVVVVPAAVVRHAQAGLRGLRGESSTVVEPEDRSSEDAESAETVEAGVDLAPTESGDAPPADAAPTGSTDASFRARRRSQLHQRFVAVPLLVLPLAVLGALLWAPVRAMYRLAIKQPGAAGDELLAAVVAVGHGRGILRARRSVHRTSVVRRRALRALSGTWREVFAERRDRRLSRVERSRTRWAPTEIEHRELRQLAVRRRLVLASTVVVLLGLTAWVFGPLLGALAGGSRLVGGALLPADSTVGGLWDAATSGWIATGTGARGPADPFLLALVPPTLLVGGNLQTAVNLLVVGAFVGAGLGAWAASGAATRSVTLRAWAVLVWVALPVLPLGVAEGRLPLVVAHAVLPWVVLGVVRAVGAQQVDRVASVVPAHRERDVPGSLGAAAAAALGLGIVVAAEPALLPGAIVVLAVVAVAHAPHRRYLAVVPLPALALAAPYLVTVLRSWDDGGAHLLLAEPGAPAVVPLTEPWHLLTGWSSTPAPWFGVDGGTWGAAARWAPFVLGALVVVAALVGLARRRVALGARVGWTVALVGLVTAVLASSAGAPADAALSFAFVGLLVAALLGLRARGDGSGSARERARARRTSRSAWRRAALGTVTGAAVLLAVAAPVGALWSWVDESTGGTAEVGQLVATDADVVPPVGRQLQGPPRLARVLSLAPSADGAVGYALLRGDGTQLVDSSIVASARESAAQDQVPGLVAGLTEGSDVADALADLGVGGVLVPTAAEQVPGRAALVAQLDTVPGLERITEGRAEVFWRVVRQDAAKGAEPVEPAWAVVTGADGTAVEELPADGRGVAATVRAGDDGRLVALAERADPGWRATLDGRALTARTVDGRQAFELGVEGGALDVSYVWPARTPWLVGGGLLLLVVVLLALPVGRRRGGVR